MCCTVLFISFIFHVSSLTKSECSVLFGRYLLLPSISYHIFSFHFFSLEFFIHYFLSVCSLITLHTTAFFKAVLDNDFRKSTKDRGLKIGTDVIRHEKQDGSFKVVGSGRISGVGVTDPNAVFMVMI